MSELVVPEEWRVRRPRPFSFLILNDLQDPTRHPLLDKLTAAAFRKAVVSRADEASFKGPDDRDAQALLDSFHLITPMNADICPSSNSLGKNEATFRRHLDALVADVFAHQYAVDGLKPEFGEGKFGVAYVDCVELKCINA